MGRHGTRVGLLLPWVVPHSVNVVWLLERLNVKMWDLWGLGRGVCGGVGDLRLNPGGVYVLELARGETEI